MHVVLSDTIRCDINYVMLNLKVIITKSKIWNLIDNIITIWRVRQGYITRLSAVSSQEVAVFTSAVRDISKQEESPLVPLVRVLTGSDFDEAALAGLQT